MQEPPAQPSAQEAGSPVPNGAFSFFALPLEIRLEIYTHLLVLPPHLPSSQQTRAFQPSLLPLSTEDARPLHPAILRSCRRACAEARAVLYGANIFVAHHTMLASFPRLRGWLPPVLTPPAGGIRRWWLRVRVDADPGYREAAVEAAFGGADELVLDVWRAAFMGGGRDVLTLFAGVRGVRHARVAGSLGGLESYAHWLEAAMRTPPGIEVVPFVPAPDEGLVTVVERSE